MFSPTTVAAQPKRVLDASQIKTLRNVILFRMLFRSDGNGAIRCLVAADRLFPRTFGLIEILQPEVRSQFNRA